jgi:hypothetical protein
MQKKGDSGLPFGLRWLRGATGFPVRLFLMCFHGFLGVKSLTAALVFSFL